MHPQDGIRNRITQAGFDGGMVNNGQTRFVLLNLRSLWLRRTPVNFRLLLRRLPFGGSRVLPLQQESCSWLDSFSSPS